MSKNRISFKSLSRKLRQRSVEFNIEPYMPLLDQINSYDFASLDDSQLKDISRELIYQARNCVPLNELLVRAYALVREVSHRVLKLHPYDVQIIAGIVMHYGGLAEMQTGEGKTLAAVFPAYLNALSGKGVHILTFNDYLAQRDSQWMGPVYKFLGLTVGYVQEEMTITERRKAYLCDITYLTAKEAGFDYLKGFLSYKQEELVHRPFNFAVIDEADSILIDEARIPLVIAGKVKTHRFEGNRMVDIIRCLKQGVEYDIDEYGRNVFLTEKGITCVEGILKCGNLYNGRNLDILEDINNALHAEVLLKRDVDYIVRNGKIELVDEFTGRVADKRHWPYGLQEAIEVKEGIKSDSKGRIIASITLQNFIRLYPKICGMTGTAQTAADEFKELYGLNVVVIPTNKPCIRKDYPDIIFTHKEAKYKALVSEIIKVHKTGRPILIGTCSVEESELLAGRLEELGVECRILNAKNDELEARIVADAGTLGAVTVSTNMAGRGTDIKLGGEHEQDREKVVHLGGLYVIGTTRYESRRIDNQLRGRAGRQGDPGSSSFFTSLEDDLFVRYRLKDLIPSPFYPHKQDSAVDSPVIKREVSRAQRIIEGQNYDIRRTLGKYSIVMEQQRRMIHKWREDILLGTAIPVLMPAKLGDRYHSLSLQIGVEALRKAEMQVTLYFINKCWADYLDYMSYIRESIHLVNMAGKVPVTEFNRTAICAFEKLVEDIQKEIINVLANAEITGNGIDMDKEGLNAPSSTWTYLVNDRPEQLGINPVALNPTAALAMWPLMLGTAVYWRFFRKTEK